jgi:RHS repeat-associated protein
VDQFGNRRLLQEVTYQQATASNGTCTGCQFHETDFLPSESSSPGYWESNGRHFDTETHSGNLGNDSRTITTTWTPANWNTPPASNAFSLPNLMSQRTESDGSTTLHKYFEYKTDTTANGFLIGSAIWDSNRQRTLLSCFYKDGQGNVRQEFSATYPNQGSPPSNACQAVYPSFPTGAVGLNGDAFGKIHAYQNGLLINSRWMATPSTPASWYLRNYVRDPVTGWVTSSNDTAGLSTSYQYDSIGRVTLIAPPGGEASTSVGYPSTTRTTATRNAGTGLSTYQQYEYDGLARLSREIHQMPGINQYTVRTHAYDGPGRRYFDSEWASCASGAGDCLTAAPGGTTSSDFDPFGRARTTVRADGSTTRVSFADGSSSYSDTKKTVTVNNLGGACSAGACTGGSASQTTYVLDAWGRTTGVTEPGGDFTSYVYDVNGKLTAVSQSNQSRTFSFDAAGFLRSETTPEKGVVTYGDYGSLGNLMKETEPDGVVRRTCYDFAGRVTETRTSEGGTPLCSYETGGPQGRLYVLNGYNNSTPDNSLGKLTSRTAWNYPSVGTYSVNDTYIYNGPGGRLSSQTTSVSGGSNLTATQGWFYNGLGLPAHHYHARSSGQTPFVVSYNYDAGLPVRYANGIPVVTGVGYRASGALAGYVTGMNVGHDVITNIVPDASLLPRPSSISTTGATVNFATGSYSYDGAGNIMAIGTDSYVYDLRSRLTSASLFGVGSQSFTYDRYGNLLTKGGTTFCSGTCANNQVTGGSFLRGNLTEYGGQSFAYDGLDRMTSSTQSSLTWNYLYDGADERAAKIPPTGSWTYTLRDESKHVASEFSATTPSRDNVFLGSQLVASFANGGVGGNGPIWVFFASDHLGTPRLLTDISGATTETRKYWPFGEAVTTQNTFESLRFATMEFDAEGGTGPGLASDRYYDHARSHVGGLGRFLSPDTIGGHPSNPQSWNRYSYTLSNPIKHVDPDGNLTILVHGTFARGRAAFFPGGSFFQNVAGTVHDRTVTSFQWSGKDSHEARVGAAKALAAYVRNYQFAPGEQLNIVAHSHGSNLTLAAINMGLGRPVDNLVTLGPPSRSGYRLLEPSRVSHWTNVYNSFDKVQTHGGGDYVSSFENGPAARTEPGALNINWNVDLGWLGSHSALYSPAAWEFTAPHLHLGERWPVTTAQAVSE